MQIQDWGEEGFIQYLKENFSTKGSIYNIGDDAAVIPDKNGVACLVTTDALVEGVHFIKEEIPSEDLGYKTVAVNVSDIVAMGGEPKYAFLSMALPKTTHCEWLRNVMQGIKRACEKWGILLLGGDTVGSKRDLFLSLTLIGSAPLTRVKYRHLAEEGDILCVTGNLGDSGGGLKVLQEGLIGFEPLTQAHFRPEVSVEQGVWIASQRGVHAMMDLSDGLDCDLRRLLASSKKGAVVEVSKIPLSDALFRASLENQWDPLMLALSGGEDYRLLVTVAKEDFENLQATFQRRFGAVLSDIGSVTNEAGRLIYQKEGETIDLNPVCYDHFSEGEHGD